MAITVASGVTTSTAANTKSSDLITGRNQFVGKGRLQVYARGSAAGMTLTINAGGIALIDDQAIPFFGATGSLSKNDHMVIDQMIAGGRIEAFLRNTTGGALTTDYTIDFTPA